MTPVEKKLLSSVVKASEDFRLIEAGDRVMVCISGGKDSYAMLHLLQLIQKRAPFELDLVAVNLDQGHPGFPGQVLESHFQSVGVEYKMLKQDTYSIVLEKIPVGKTFCSLCSRLRRGILYNAAVELGCNKIALGHHKDDIIETFMLNILYSGQNKAMPPRYTSDDGRNIVIRPLSYCNETDIVKLADELSFPIIPCDLCGTQENLKRQKVKRLISELQAENETVRGSIFNAIRNIRPSHLLDPTMRALAGLDPATADRLPASTAHPFPPLGPS